MVRMPGEGRPGRQPSPAQPRAAAAARAGSPSAPVCPTLRQRATWRRCVQGRGKVGPMVTGGSQGGTANRRHRTSEHDVIVGLGLGRDVLRRWPVLCAVRLDCKAQQVNIMPQ